MGEVGDVSRFMGEEGRKARRVRRIVAAGCCNSDGGWWEGIQEVARIMVAVVEREGDVKCCDVT